MTPDQLKQRISTPQITEVDGTLLAKCSAADGFAFSRRFSAIPENAPDEQTVEAYAFLLSKCIVDASGAKLLDTDDSREDLAKLDFVTLRTLGEAAIRWNLGDSKKN